MSQGIAVFQGTNIHLCLDTSPFAEDGSWGKLSALGIMMIFISTTIAVVASLIGMKMTRVKEAA